MLHDQDTFTHDGHNFRIKFEHDDYTGAPWSEFDCHGIVSDWTSRAKEPGEMILNQDRGSYRYYDFARTMHRAKVEGWSAEPHTGSRGERAARAVFADYNRLRRWCNDDWCYVTLIVELLDDDGDPIGEYDTIGGVESDCADHIQNLAEELATQILDRLAATLAA